TEESFDGQGRGARRRVDSPAVIIDVDLTDSAAPVTLAEPEDCKRFHVAARGGDAAALASALEAAGAGRLLPSGEAMIEIGVVRLCGAGIARKTERGLVKLGLRDGAAVEAAAAELLGAARREDGDVGLLVGAMVAGARELIAGFVRDDQFGPCVMLGIGGVLAEALGDVAFRLAPLEPVDADDLVDELSNQALLGPVRGEPPVDRAALAGILLGLA